MKVFRVFLLIFVTTGWLGGAHAAVGQSPGVELSLSGQYYNTLNEGSDINVTATITSESPLLSLKWMIFGGGDLPFSATNYSYTDNSGVIHSTLSLHCLSRNNSGNYSIVATNEYGTQIASVNIKVEGQCIQTENPPPGTIIKPPPSNIVTVQGEYLQIPCLALGTVRDNLCNFWNISLPEHRIINVHDNSSDLYRLAVYQTDLINCTFDNQLIITNVSQKLHGAVLICIEGIKLRGIEWIVALFTSNTTLSVYDYPEVLNITVWPGNTNIKVGDNVTLQCQLKGAPMMYTDVMWLHNGSSVDKMKHFEIENGSEIFSTLNIADFAQRDGGNFTCYCSYDRNKVKTEEAIISNAMSVMVYAEDDNNVHGKHTQRILVLLKVVAVVGGLVTATLIISLVVLGVVLHIRCCGNQKDDESSDDEPSARNGSGPANQSSLDERSPLMGSRTGTVRGFNDSDHHSLSEPTEETPRSQQAIEWSARIAVNSSTEVTTSAPVPVESSARPISQSPHGRNLVESLVLASESSQT